MEDVFVGQLMSSPVHTVQADDPVQDAARVMSEEGIGSIVAVDGDGHLEGIMTSTDFVHIVLEDRAADRTTVREYMRADVTATSVNEPVRDVADTMLSKGIHHAPVVDDEEGVVGMLTTKDMAAYLSHTRVPSPVA